MISQDYVIDEINLNPLFNILKEKHSMLRDEILKKSIVSLCWYILKRTNFHYVSL